MLICSNVSPLALGGIDRAAEDFHELGERAAKRGLRVGYEALAWGRHINDHRDAWEIVRRADHANIGLILDSFHTLARRIDVNSIRAIPKDKIFRSEEHTSELQSLMRTSYAVFCLKKKRNTHTKYT